MSPDVSVAATVDGDAFAALDPLVERWNRPDSPGCAVGVYREGALVSWRGVGMADLDHRVPIGVRTSFHAASLSKQFTAAAVLLLEQQSRLSLDDDVRAHLPEMAALPARITLRHLLYHTSGLRDQWALLELAGWRYSRDLITQGDVLDLVRRQHTLNFNPGERVEYCNSGYTLLAEIVARTSGGSFAEFARASIFAPLGMDGTAFRDDYGALVPGAATGYEWDGERGRHRIRQVQLETVGATGLQTTVADLARWDENFYAHRLGGPEFVSRLLAPGSVVAAGRLAYAAGLVVGTYRGIPIVRHGGADAGFRAELLRIPGAHLSVAILANVADLPASLLARRVADAYLGEAAPPPRPAAPRQVPDDESDVDAQVLSGMYWDSEADHFMSIREHEGSLAAHTSGQVVPLTREGPLRYRCTDAVTGDRVTLTFERGVDGAAARVEVHFSNSELSVTYQAWPDAPMDAAALDEYEGHYASDEVAAIHRIARSGTALTWCRPRHQPAALHPAGVDVFSSRLGTLRFEREPSGAVASFMLSGFGVRRLRFVRGAALPLPCSLT